jgi:predicted nucleic acid-binding protein
MSQERDGIYSMKLIERRRSKLLFTVYSITLYAHLIYRLSLEGWDEVRKKASLQKFEDNIMRDDITVCVSYLQNIHQL